MKPIARLLLAAVAAVAPLGSAQTPTPTSTPTAAPYPALKGADLVRARYTKFEYRIPMRDGVRLFTSVYVPKDATAAAYPILLTRTPYGVAPYGVDKYRESLGPSEAFLTEKFIFVYQDVRGRLRSEGDYVNARPYEPRKTGKETDETTDTYDTIDWLVKNVKGNNGRVGMWGISYPGFYSAIGLIDAHPALEAVSPQAPIADWFVGDDFHHHGAFFLPHAFNFFSSFGKARTGPTSKSEPRFEHGTPDGYSYFAKLPPLSEVNAKLLEGRAAFWDDLVKHDTYDAFWQARNLRPHLKGIRPAVMTVGGWFDAENLYGALQVYKSIEAQSPGARNVLVMGPWIHGGWARTEGDLLGDVRFGDRTSQYYRENVELPFFVSHLKVKDGAPAPAQPEATVFETGRNQWRTFDAWPPKEAKPRVLHLREGGALAWEAGKDQEAFDEYVSDPARPVPNTSEIAIGMTKEYMTGDQRFAATRPDVLVYQTGVLEDDLTLAGEIRADLLVSTTGTDSDWVVKVIDVYPDDYPDPDPNPAKVRMGGYQQLVRGNVMRGKFRDGYEKPQPFTPGKATRVAFGLNDVFHTFRSGHRLMVQVQSSWFPLVDRNPQVYMNVFAARPGDFRKATQRVYRGSGGSRLEVSTLD